MKDKAPFFTVVIPVFNKGPHIDRNIKSVLRQQFQDFELLLVNDASTDNSLEEMLKFSDPRIRILHRPAPGPGAGPARNLGIREAKAEWVAFLDADDEWYPEHLKKMNELIERFPDVKFLSCGWETRGDGPLFQNKYFHRHASGDPRLIDCKNYLELSIAGCGPVWTGVAVVNKGIQFASHLFPEEKGTELGEDTHAWAKLMCSLKSMVWSPHIGAIYHRDSVNMLTKTAKPSLYFLRKEVFQELAGSLDQVERQLLGKVFNKRILSRWKRDIVEKRDQVKIIKRFFWRGNMAFCGKWALISLLPAPVLRSLARLKRSLRGTL